jgi:hypothetical protein
LSTVWTSGPKKAKRATATANTTASVWNPSTAISLKL